MTKSDLKTGMRVYTRDGREYIVMKDVDAPYSYGCDHLIGFDVTNGSEPLKDYNDDLTNKNTKHLDINLVFRPKDAVDIFKYYDEKDFDLVWKREEEPIEITIEEIAELKGVSPDRIRIKEKQ